MGSEIVSRLIGCNKDLMANSWAGRRGQNFQAERGKKQREIKSSNLEGTVRPKPSRERYGASHVWGYRLVRQVKLRVGRRPPKQKALVLN